jgi:uncharacterized repeat protein (TIGR02543 family)
MERFKRKGKGKELKGIKRKVLSVLVAVFMVIASIVGTGIFGAATAYAEDPVLGENIYYVSSGAVSTDWSAASNISTPCTVDTAMANAVAGDTVYFLAGTYNTDYLNDYHASWEPQNSGIASAPITFAAYPEAAVIINGVAPDGKDMVRVFSTGNKDYIIFDGFMIQANNGTKMGSIIIGYNTNSWDNTSDNCIVRNCTLDGGSAVPTVDSEFIRIEWAQNTLIQNCVIKNAKSPKGSGVKMIRNKNTIVENCEICDCGKGIVADFTGSEFSTFRYNYIHHCSLNGISLTENNANSHSDVSIYHNVIAFCSRASIDDYVSSGAASSDRMRIFNNTIYSGSAQKTASINLAGGYDKEFYNNIIYGLKLDNDVGLLRFWPLTAATATTVTIAACDHNQYGNLAGNFLIKIRRPDGVGGATYASYSSLASWQTSTELVGGGHPGVGSLASDPGFVNASGTMSELNDFRLAAGSPCLGAGRGGIDMGVNIDLVGVLGETFTVSFESNGGSAVDSVIVASGSLLPLPSKPAKSGYTFAGWYKDAELTNAWNFNTDTVTEDITLYAKWTEGVPQNFTVSFESNGGSAVDSVSVEEGSLLERPVNPVKTGYSFAGWYKDAELTQEWNFALDVVAANITLYVKWLENIYYVSSNAASTNWDGAKNNMNAPCTVATAMANAKAGDTVYFLEGTYITSGGNHYHATWEPANSGTAGAPITFAAYPGAEVIIEGICPGEMTNIVNSPVMVRVFSTGKKDYIIFDGFTIRANDGAGVDKIGSIIIGYDIHSWSDTSDNCIIRNCIFDGRTTKILGGDLVEAVRIEWTRNTLVQNCVIKNIRGVAATESNNNKSGIKMYHNKNTMIENCEIFNCTVGIYDKSDGESSTYKNNYIHDSFLYGIYVTNFASGGNVYNHPDIKAYNNVIANSREFSYYEESTSNSYCDRENLFNNTFYNGNAAGVNVQMFGGADKRFYNNIIQGKMLSDYYGVLKFFVPTNTLSVPVTIAECDYNQYGSLDFQVATRKNIGVTSTHRYYTLPDWQNSTELDSGDGHPDVYSIASDPMFENASGTMLKLEDFRLAQGSPCLGTGKEGVNMGADIDQVGPDLPNYTRRTVVFYSDEYKINNNSYQTAMIVDAEQGSLLVKPVDPVKIGFVFSGWYTSRDLSTEWDFENDQVEANMVLYAKWSGAAESVIISEESLKFDDIGAARTLTATVKPDDAINKEVTWTSDNNAVATVDANGTVTAVGEGTTTITAKVVGTEITAACTVTVRQVTRITFAAPQTVAKHETFTVTIGLKTLKQILSADLVIGFDNDLVKYKGYKEIDGGLLVAGCEDHGQGHESARFLLTGIGAEGAVSGAEDVRLIELRFTARKNIADLDTVHVTRAVLADTQGDILLPTLPNGAAQVSKPGDLNFDGTINIADLEIASLHAGKTTESPDWDTAKYADINKDGKVDWDDLSAIAREVLR